MVWGNGDGAIGSGALGFRKPQRDRLRGAQRRRKPFLVACLLSPRIRPEMRAATFPTLPRGDHDHQGDGFSGGFEAFVGTQGRSPDNRSFPGDPSHSCGSDPMIAGPCREFGFSCI
jgi:hypothetical protein